jgi:hypothetical protein
VTSSTHWLQEVIEQQTTCNWTYCGFYPNDGFRYVYNCDLSNDVYPARRFETMGYVAHQVEVAEVAPSNV